MTRSIHLALVGALAASSSTFAQHVGDIAATIEGGAIATAANTASGAVAERVFGATFGDTGIARFTTNPGIEALPGTFVAGSRLGFNAVAGLRRFTGSSVETVTDERLEVKFLTLVRDIGAEPVAGFDLAVQSNGGFHRHFNFTLKSAGAKLPASGIYVAELELYSTDGTTGASTPFWIVFNDGRPAEELTDALAWVEENLASDASACVADLDGSGDVGAADLGILLAAWGGLGADLDDDGATGASDLSILLAAWGSCAP